MTNNVKWSVVDDNDLRYFCSSECFERDELEDAVIGEANFKGCRISIYCATCDGPVHEPTTRERLGL